MSELRARVDVSAKAGVIVRTTSATVEAGSYNFSVPRDGTTTLLVTWQDDRQVVRDLTGEAATMEISETWSQEIPDLMLDEDGAIAITDGGSGANIEITFDAAAMEALPSPRLVYRLRVAGQPLLAGFLTVR